MPILETILGGTVLGPLVELGKTILDKIPDPNLREKLKADYEKSVLDSRAQLEMQIFEVAKAQLAVNEEEAKHPSIFVAGWRPAIGWISAFGLAYQYGLHPMLAWFSTTVGIAAPPTIDLGSLMTLLVGMLGLGAYRTYEKYQEVDTKKLGGK